MIAPKVDAFSNDYAEKASFYKLDVDEHQQIAAELEVRAMPTFLFFKDGKKVSEVVGANPSALKVCSSFSVGDRMEVGWVGGGEDGVRC